MQINTDANTKSHAGPGLALVAPPRELFTNIKWAFEYDPDLSVELIESSVVFRDAHSAAQIAAAKTGLKADLPFSKAMIVCPTGSGAAGEENEEERVYVRTSDGRPFTGATFLWAVHQRLVPVPFRWDKKYFLGGVSFRGLFLTGVSEAGTPIYGVDFQR